MCSPLRHAYLVDRRAAAEAGQTGPPIDVKVILRLALLPIRLAIPVNTRALMVDAGLQRVAYRLMQSLRITVLQ